MTVVENGTGAEEQRDLAHGMEQHVQKAAHKTLRGHNGKGQKNIGQVADGGKGQLHSAINSLKKLDLYGKISILGLAKQMEEIYFPEDKDPYLLAKNSIALKTLMHIRDEAHRFGITFHRSLREKAQIKRLFSHIKGIGEQTEIKLLQEYNTYENVKNASLEELTRVIGKRAEILYSYLHSMDKV